MRRLVTLIATAALLAFGAAPAAADQPSRAPLPLGASGGALWTDAGGGEHWLHVAGSIGSDGTTELLADTYVSTPVTCPDGSVDTRVVSWMGGRIGRGGISVDKQLGFATINTTLDLDGFTGGACGSEPGTLDPVPTVVSLTVTATSRAIHSLQIERRHDGAKPTGTVTHATLRLAAGTVRIGSSQHATTEGTIDRNGSGLGDGSALATTPDHSLMEASGRYASGEVHVTRESAQPGQLLVDESAVNAANPTGEPVMVYAGRHTTKVIQCGTDLATVDTFWEAIEPGTLQIASSLRTAHASAALALQADRYDACADTHTTWTTPVLAVRLDVVADTRPQSSRSLSFDHEAGWVMTRLTGSSRARDGTGTFDIGSLHRAFDTGGILTWSRSYRDLNHNR
jgi:hypothetical protein